MPGQLWLPTDASISPRMRSSAWFETALPISQMIAVAMQTLCGMQRLHALPSVRCRDEALRPLVGFHAPHVRQGRSAHGGRPRGRPGGRRPGPICPETLAQSSVQWHLRDLAMVATGVVDQGVWEGTTRWWLDQHGGKPRWSGSPA